MAELHLPDLPDIPGMHVRRPRDDDADFTATAELIAAANRVDGIPWIPTARHLRDEAEHAAGWSPADEALLVEVDGVVVADAAVERAVRDGVAVYETSGHVLPAWRRRGIGTALLRENLRRARERAAAEPADQPWALAGFADESEIGHLALLRNHGFEPVRWFFVMRRDLTAPVPEASMPAGLELRPLTRDQHRVVFEAEAEAFRDHWNWREPTEEDAALTYGRSEFDPDLWVVAWDGDEVAGVAQGWIWADENAALGVARGWLEHISVRRPWRRRGLARALTTEAMRRFAAAGMTDAMLGVDAASPTGALGLYESLGFTVHTRSMAFRRQG
ncbi:MAG: GNAT family N-acetyltransferase [Candidatus Limnocylindria bacterium]